MKILRRCWASFAAVQAGALVSCIGLMILDAGLVGSFEGFGVWLLGQMVILPIALAVMPILLLLRWGLGKAFYHPFPVALCTGIVIGVTGALYLSYSANAPQGMDFAGLTIGALSGLVGGWVWFWDEGPPSAERDPTAKSS